MKKQLKNRVPALSGMMTLVSALAIMMIGTESLYAKEKDSAPVKETVTANNWFAIDLYNALAKEGEGKNVFFSPYSIMTALTMTADGARGETARQMGKVLCFPESVRHIGEDAKLTPWRMSPIHTGLNQINTMLTSQEDPRQADQFQLKTANAVWVDKHCFIIESFRETIEKFYQTGAFATADFRENYEVERKRINAWVEKQTENRIKDLLRKDTLDALTRMVLVNAIYFKGEWANRFEEKNTKDAEFSLSDGSRVKVPLMHAWDLDGAQYAAFNADGTFFRTPSFAQESNARNYPGKGGFAIATLPYKGKALSMVLIAPQDHDGLPAIEKQLTATALSTWIQALISRPINVKLPQFKMESDHKLKDTLKTMGMVDAFNDPRQPHGADFSGINGLNKGNEALRIDKVLHRAFLEVNEKGTEAAATTAVIMRASESATPDLDPFTPTFSADRPFLMLIRHNATGTILFMGRMVKPN